MISQVYGHVTFFYLVLLRILKLQYQGFMVLLVSFRVLRAEHIAELDNVLCYISTLVIGTSRKEIKICLEQSKEN